MDLRRHVQWRQRILSNFRPASLSACAESRDASLAVRKYGPVFFNFRRSRLDVQSNGNWLPARRGGAGDSTHHSDTPGARRFHFPCRRYDGGNTQETNDSARLISLERSRDRVVQVKSFISFCASRCKKSWRPRSRFLLTAIHC